MTDSIQLQSLAEVLLLLGLLLWVFSPVFERIAGDPGAISSLIGGYLALGASVLFGSVAPGLPLVAYCAVVIIFWGAVTYVLFLSGRDEPRKRPSEGATHCVPKLIHGSPKSYDDHKWRIRARLTVAFEVVPSNCKLAIYASATGRAYYGVYFARRPLDLTPHVEIVCVPGKNGTCVALAQISPPTQKQDSPLTLQVDHTISQSSEDVTIRTTITAAVSASGGGIGVSAVGVGGSVSLTSAAIAFQVPMGTFLWRCVAEGECKPGERKAAAV
jgi:hypothetical protein